MDKSQASSPTKGSNEPTKEKIKPLLFKGKIDVPKAIKDVDTIPVTMRIKEINLLKIKKNEKKPEPGEESELSEFQRTYKFEVKKDDIPHAKILKNNFIPSDEKIDLMLSMNLSLPTPSLEMLQALIRALIQKGKTQSDVYILDINESSSWEYLQAAAVLGLDELYMAIFYEFYESSLDVLNLVHLTLFAIEYDLPQSSLFFYQQVGGKIFRDYLIFREGLSPQKTPMVKRITNAGDGARLIYEKDVFQVFNNQELQFSFASDVFKSVFNIFKKKHYDKYFKPEMRYHVIKIRRKKTETEYDGELLQEYPHRYFMSYDHNDHCIVYAVRFTEHGQFHLFTGNTDNEQIFGADYVGCVEPNYVGTEFKIFDMGFDEKSLAKMPKYFGFIRSQLAVVKYERNIMGEVPRDFTVDYFNFIEKKMAKLDSMKPKFDPQKDCYTLNFYGRAKKASARNFILTYPEDQNEIILMHGKAEKNLFNLDFRHPLNFVQAFSISLISIGKKFFVA